VPSLHTVPAVAGIVSHVLALQCGMVQTVPVAGQSTSMVQGMPPPLPPMPPMPPMPPVPAIPIPPAPAAPPFPPSPACPDELLELLELDWFALPALPPEPPVSSGIVSRSTRAMSSQPTLVDRIVKETKAILEGMRMFFLSDIRIYHVDLQD
jgi:hypothetical protein